jgi:hypothetical protein
MPTLLNKEWKPNPGPQELFLSCPAFEVLYGGAKGGGKTDALLMEALRYKDIEGVKVLLLRRTYPRLTEIIDRSFLFYQPLGATYFKQEHRWVFNNGFIIQFGHCQREEDKYNYHGHEYQVMMFDQVEEFTEPQYLFLMAQCRTSNPKVKTYIRATANPGNVGHLWVKQRFIQNREPFKIKYYKINIDQFGNPSEVETTKDDKNSLSRCFIPAKVYDNPALMDNDPMYINRLKMLPDKELKALLEGNWDIFVGQYFTEWCPDDHICNPRALNTGFRKAISIDYGYSAPSAVLWYEIDYDGKLTLYRELYVTQMTYESLARKILELTSANEVIDYAVADPAIWGDRSKVDATVGESGGETMANILGGRILLQKADHNRITGWGRCREFLQKRQFEVFRTCHNFIRTIPAMIHDESRVEDLDKQGEDHCADSWRYMLMSRSSITDRPEPDPEFVVRPRTHKRAVEQMERVQKERELEEEYGNDELYI